MVSIHRPLSRLLPSPLETISSFAPLPPTSQPSSRDDRSYWLHTRKCLEAAEIATNLYTLPIPMLQHSPLGITSIALATCANLSSCAYTLNGTERSRARDRVRLGLGGLKKLAEAWSNARRTEREIKFIARSVFAGHTPPNQSLRNPANNFATQSHHTFQTIGGTSSYDFASFQGHQMGQQHDQIDVTAFDEELGSYGGGINNHMNVANMEYLAMLDNLQPMNDIRS